ncbi:MAG: sigma 54-interacting transcriptional regulator [Clostridia bacterium]|nr:sigma 54-interacting transcriptional regulator [Clostridia bacterium]
MFTGFGYSNIAEMVVAPLGEVAGNLEPAEALNLAQKHGWQGVVASLAPGKWQGALTGWLREGLEQGCRRVGEVMVPLLPLANEGGLESWLSLFGEEPYALGLILEQNKPVGLVSPAQIGQQLWTVLKQRDAQLGAVLDTVHEAVTMIDRENRVIGWNRAAQEMYRIPAEEILGKKIDHYFTSLVVTEMRNKVAVRDAYHQPCAGTHVLINASPIKVGNEIVGSVAAERDITETVYLHNELSKASSQVRLLEQEISKINSRKEAFSNIYGHSRKLTEVINLAKKVANTDAAVLIRGESGTGKELFAEAIHQASRRHDKPFIVINCGAIPAGLFESELFGYQPGAFTGADRKGRPGKFELAHEGTVFLDEIGELSPELQVKLLRVLQGKRIYRVGGGEPVEVDVRVIAATNRDLEKLIQKGAFREDLYYRINVVSLEVPPLRERRDDIPELLYLFIREFCHQHQRDLVQVDQEVMDMLLRYPWPGNVRELRNVVERMVVLAEGQVLGVDTLPEAVKQYHHQFAGPSPTNLAEMREENERQIILNALREAEGNRSLAARLLGIPRSTLYYKMKVLKIK